MILNHVSLAALNFNSYKYLWGETKHFLIDKLMMQVILTLH